MSDAPFLVLVESVVRCAWHVHRRPTRASAERLAAQLREAGKVVRVEHVPEPERAAADD